jgi:hypothetical protein
MRIKKLAMGDGIVENPNVVHKSINTRSPRSIDLNDKRSKSARGVKTLQINY